MLRSHRILDFKRAKLAGDIKEKMKEKVTLKVLLGKRLKKKLLK